LKRASAIIVLVFSSVVIWAASSPTDLNARALPSKATSLIASTVSRAASHTQTVQALASNHRPLGTPLALLLQGIIFLACGSLWLKQSPEARTGIVVRGSAKVETAAAD
jgi:hypothetical protein